MINADALRARNDAMPSVCALNRLYVVHLCTTTLDQTSVLAEAEVALYFCHLDSVNPVQPSSAAGPISVVLLRNSHRSAQLTTGHSALIRPG